MDTRPTYRFSILPQRGLTVLCWLAQTEIIFTTGTCGNIS
jgi:hypothetical protein